MNQHQHPLVSKDGIFQSLITRRALCPGQLRKTLPAMVIEIVEEKLEQESLENATKFMMGQMGEVSGEDRKEGVDPWTLPRHWDPMDINGVGRSRVYISHFLLTFQIYIYYIYIYI